MRLSIFLGAVLHSILALLSVPTLASLGDEQAKLLKARQTNTIAITGVQNNGVQVRMEIRTMEQQQPDMWNVYLLGLRDMMDNTNELDPLSYYQIAGIHGRPYIPWNGVGSAPGYGGGYCTHVQNLFLPWHRPYLALYEQVLYSHVQKVAASFPAGVTRDKYVAAANKFRAPYWDWAAEPCPTCASWPVLVQTPYVQLNTPNGTRWVRNPLFRYDFHPLPISDMVYNPFATWTVTKRFPTSWNTNATSQNWLIGPEFDNNQNSFKDRLYNLYTSYTNFSQFGNEAWISSSTQNADSLESLHDVIHSLTGNNGHMTYLDYSAFDPIFWLHHVMIDRSFALWQALYPNSYVEPAAAENPTFSYPAGTVNDVNSPLPPFYSDTVGTSWTPARAVNITVFGYTYPELANGATQSNLRASINRLYGTTPGGTTVSKVKRSNNTDTSAAKAIQSAVSQNGTSYQYIANVVSQKFALNGSYAVYVFLGNVSDDSSTWSTSQNLVGTHGVFANLRGDNAWVNMRASSMNNVRVTGSIPLTTTLINKISSGKLSDLSPASVESYLKQNLRWRIAMFDGTSVPASNVPDLSLTVVQAQVQPAVSADSFPVWGNFVNLVNVTSGQDGGHDSRMWGQNGNGGATSSTTTSSTSAVETSSIVTITTTTYMPLGACIWVSAAGSSSLVPSAQATSS